MSQNAEYVRHVPVHITQRFGQIAVENKRLRAFVARVSEYSNDSWLAQEALALLAQIDSSGVAP